MSSTRLYQWILIETDLINNKIFKLKFLIYVKVGKKNWVVKIMNEKFGSASIKYRIVLCTTSTPVNTLQISRNYKKYGKHNIKHLYTSVHISSKTLLFLCTMFQLQQICLNSCMKKLINSNAFLRLPFSSSSMHRTQNTSTMCGVSCMWS